MFDWLIKPNVIDEEKLEDAWYGLNPKQTGIANRFMLEIHEMIGNNEAVRTYKTDLHTTLVQKDIDQVLYYVRSWFYHKYDGVAVNFSDSGKKVTIRK